MAGGSSRPRAFGGRNLPIAVGNNAADPPGIVRSPTARRQGMAPTPSAPPRSGGSRQPTGEAATAATPRSIG
jgi:hypothetical protein